MAVFNGAFPVLPGKEDKVRAFAKECAGPRKRQFDEGQSRVGTTRETWALQPTPAGSFVLVWFDGDVDAAFEDLATAQDEFSIWFRAQIEEITGVDMSQPPEEGSAPEMIFEWEA